MINRLEQIRIENNMTQKELASELGMSESSYTRLKVTVNPRDLKIIEAIKLANTYGVNLNWLILGSGETYDQKNNFESTLSRLIDTTNKQYGDDEFVKKLLIDTIIKKIDKKVQIKENMNQRPLFMFRKILKEIEIETIPTNAKDFLKTKIKKSKDPLKATYEKLNFKIDNLTNEECYFIIINRDLFIQVMEKKVLKADIVIIDFLDNILFSIKEFFKKKFEK